MPHCREGLMQNDREARVMMVRIMSVLPLVTGALCVLIVLIGAIGYTSSPEEVEVPIPPCPLGGEDCKVGMNQDDLSIPRSFMLLKVETTMRWDHPDDAWVGVVDAKYAEECPPDNQGLTDCTASDMVFLAGGPDSTDSMVWDLDPGDVRFVTGGRANTLTLETNIVTHSYSIGISVLPMLLLGVAGVALCLSGVQMAFPLHFSKKDGG